LVSSLVQLPNSKWSRWIFKIIQSSEVLTLSRDYFRLRKPIERRIYEIARKHCGEQDEWHVSLPLLHKKVGSTSTDRKFRLEGDVVVFQKKVPEITYPRLDPETYNDAKIMVPGYDVYYLENENSIFLAP
jgi:hypothetical protein